MTRITSLLGAALTLTATAACATNAAQADDSVWDYQAENASVGRIYYYERSNTDGSLDERITMFHRSETQIDVYKENGLCRNAALVTAELDPETLSASRVVGGQLLPNAEHMEFAFIELDEASNELNLEVRLPQMTITDTAQVESGPWHVYDFDLASLTVMTPHLVDQNTAFDFGMLLLWADPSSDDPMFWMGDVTATPDAHVEHLGHQTRRYALSGSALTGERATGGDAHLWLDAEEGYIVDAVFPTPSHPGYTDFRLRLDHVSDGGLAEWEALLTAHFEGCDE
ncbi:hypothetical protein [Maricaulis parjimensis]|uniref:hypothetical protein n=1 Tax=Maricaulis parjimensis TaxID=144023 RepID=UPI00193A66AD|nr:hypothetical protein [Maricaulis parjimensis]